MQVTKSLELGDLHERYASEYIRLQSQQKEHQSEHRNQHQRFPSAARFSNRLPSIRQSNEEHLKGGEHINSVAPTHSPYTSILQFDPLGPPAERPKTGRPLQSTDDVDDDAEMNAEILLPI
ncbi:uncharacterized protein LOC116801007 isoform X1 [Drosophila sechellia]|nr:uncharacterized protein LOC116801004 isoform X1 [Drosophila sechellia]XP_032574005.1 uncharacterized protein LOC116801007 isoform X1 [Drosophila sechellia]